VRRIRIRVFGVSCYGVMGLNYLRQLHVLLWESWESAARARSERPVLDPACALLRIRLRKVDHVFLMVESVGFRA